MKWLQDKTEQVILGSGSPRRRELLQLMQISFQVDKSTSEEVPHSSEPWEVVMELATQKASEVADRHRDGNLVIGADTIVALNDRILGKPADEAEAAEMLYALQGKTHQVYTGVCLIRQTGTEQQKEVIEKHGWATESEVMDYYAIGQCTPGIIAVNAATFIGYKVKGVSGGIVATLGVVSPSLIIIFLISTLITNFSELEVVQHALRGIQVAVCVLMFVAIEKLLKNGAAAEHTLFAANHFSHNGCAPYDELAAVLPGFTVCYDGLILETPAKKEAAP